MVRAFANCLLARPAVWIAAVASATAIASPALAGMPSIGFSEMARLRLEAISFFLAGLLLSAAVVWRLWNWLCEDFTGWPRLTYPKACAAVGLWGLLFVIVLTMISGARELMTPGAWKKNGALYSLRENDPSPAPVADRPERVEERRRSLERLATLLAAFAVQHQGRYPTGEETKLIPAEVWRIPDASQMEYVYVTGLSTSHGKTPLVYEPNIFPGDALVLYADGGVAWQGLNSPAASPGNDRARRTASR